MKIIADENMSAVQECFAPYGTVETLAGRDMHAASVAEADILLVRSVTRVDAQLLAGSRVKFVGSATIGTDHIDINYLQQKGIHFAHAPGCNAEAVVQYVLSVFCTLEPQWRAKKVGIVGCGNVGGRLWRRLSALGVACQVYDPFLSATACDSLTNLEAVLDADIICLHTPLTLGGKFPSHHLIDQRILEEFIRPGALLINAGRGGVIDNAALLTHLQAGADLNVALDVWEGEPAINLALLQQVKLATPHIAGYSLEGRLRGTQMVRDAMCCQFDLGVPKAAVSSLAVGGAAQRTELGGRILLAADETADRAVLASYSVGDDDQNMRAVLAGSGVGTESHGQLFDGLRKNYAQRREFSHYRVGGPGQRACHKELEILGFKTG